MNTSFDAKLQQKKLEIRHAKKPRDLEKSGFYTKESAFYEKK